MTDALTTMWARERRLRRARLALWIATVSLAFGGVIGLTNIQPDENIDVLATLDGPPTLATFEQLRDAFGSVQRQQTTEVRGAFGPGSRSTWSTTTCVHARSGRDR